jgi:DNA modification methylase
MLGEHRLLIDDCTVKENVDRLMAGEKADMVFTDPPYGVDYDGGTTKRQKLENDHSNDIYDSVLPVIRDAMSDQAALYVWHAAGYADIASKLIESGFQIRSQIIWNKNQAQFGALSAQYKQKHEPCFYSHKKGNSPLWYGPTNEVTVWDVSRERKNEFHPTQKPVELCKRALKNNSQQKNLILDVFLGSGSTLIACEKTNRRCFGMEIDAHYGQVIIERFQKFSGKKAVREDGVAFDEINGLKKTSV